MPRRSVLLAAGTALVVLLSCSTVVPAQAAAPPAVPFGSHPTPRPAGWAGAPGGAAAADTATLNAYREWKSDYVTAGCGPDRYYVDTSTSTPYTVVSEGQGYGMVITALMAGADPDARTVFDGMFRYVKDHPSEGDPDLMAWQQTDCASEPDNAGSATDGDLDVAYGLLLAHRQWGSTGGIDYLGEAKRIIAAIKRSEFNPSTKLPLFGDWVTKADSARWNATRSSDLMIEHFREFQDATGDAFWGAAATAADRLIGRVTMASSPATALLPDFVVKTNTTTPKPAPAGFQEGPNDGQAYWNASRVPWRLAANAYLGDSPASTRAIGIQTAWIIGATGGNPARVQTGYHLNGTPIDAYNSLLFTAPFAAAALSTASKQTWLDAVWLNIEKRSDGYFADSVKLQTMLLVSGNYWRP